MKNYCQITCTAGNFWCTNSSHPDDAKSKAGSYNVDKEKRTGMSLFTGILYFTTCTSQGRIWGWVEGALATPFSLKFCSIFIEFSQKYKVFIYSWQVENGPGHPFLNFLDPPLLQMLEWPLKWWITLFYMATSMKEFNKSAFGKLNVTLKFSEWVCNSQRDGWKWEECQRTYNGMS